LAAYSFFVMIASVVTAWFSTKTPIHADKKPINTDNYQREPVSIKKFWFYLSVATLALSPIVIFLTKTRGALVGLATIILAFLLYFITKPTLKSIPATKTKPMRFWSLMVLMIMVVFGATLFFTREAPVWQKIPGIDRLVQVSAPGGGSIQVRLLGWKLAVNAFLEKPIFGWGPEHYLLAFQERYDPEFSTYGEFWLDRAHNGVLDVATMQGALGLIGYVGFLTSLFYFFLRKEARSKVHENDYQKLQSNYNQLPHNHHSLRFFIGIIFLGFTVQNLFLLEEFHTFTPFFVLVAAVIAGVFSGVPNHKFSAQGGSFSERQIPSPKQITNSNDQNSKNWNLPMAKLLAVVGSALVLVIVSFVIYKTILVPTAQAYYTHKAETPQNKEEFLNFWSKATKPYNFAQYSIRSYLFDFFYANQPTVFTDPQSADIGNKFVDSIREVLLRDGAYDIRSHIRLSQAHYEIAKQIPPTGPPLAHYRAGEKILREALKISPLKQELIYGLGFALAGQGRYEEAISLMEKSIASNPYASRISRLHYYYGLILSAAGRGEEALRAFENVRRADPQLTRLGENDIKGLFSIYESLGESARIIEIITESARGLVQTKINLHYYEIALLYYLDKEDGENIIIVAEFIAKKFPERKDDMEAIIDLARNGDWSILKSL
ncbi:MAG: O-antigen ligase family protein, partial [Patescibacteria group bacterium]